MIKRLVSHTRKQYIEVDTERRVYRWGRPKVTSWNKLTRFTVDEFIGHWKFQGYEENYDIQIEDGPTGEGYVSMTLPDQDEDVIVELENKNVHRLH